METCLKDIEEFLSTTKYSDKFRNGMGDKKTVEAVKNIAAVIPVLLSRRTCDVMVASLKIVSIMADADLPGFGEHAGGIISVCSAILGTIWKDNQNIESTIMNDIVAEELKSKVKGILATFYVSDYYLSTLESKCQDVNQKDIDHMMSVIDLYQGSEMLGNLRCKIENGIKFQDVAEAKRIICIVILYVRIAVIRSSMLWRMFSVLTSCTKKWLGVWKMNDSEIANTSDAIRNTIKKEDEIHKQFLKFLTEPDYKTITLLSVFNPSEHIEISTFVRSLGMEFQRLTHYLQGTFAIKLKRRNHFWLIMSRNVTGSMRGSLNPNKNQHLFRFQEVSAKDSIFTIFSIRWPSWYVHMSYHRTCRGYNEASIQIGPQAQWN
ncbi:toxin CfTX-B-like [Mytilus edulis]|uniref:toxin CfTX-B-like n=1 Tax=Mytilus edulis TaxID=6550 RepID=UPI0039EF83CE